MSGKRNAPIGMTGAEFKQVGYQLVEQLAGFIDNIARQPVTTNLSPAQLSDIVGRGTFPETGKPAADIVHSATEILLSHSLLNGHPRFCGYITSAAAPIGALADLLAAAVNPNVGAGILSPAATAIEKQVVKWLGEFIGLPPCFDGLLVSGGNMANFTAFCAAIHIKVPQNKKLGLGNAPAKPTVYCSRTTHTWIDKAAAFSGMGTDSIRWIPADKDSRMDIDALEKAIREDRSANRLPIMVIGTAGDVGTGAVDDLQAIAGICKRYDCWFHIDGAYGIPAAVLPECQPLFQGMADADSIAVDPHKWLYAPLEAGCTLVKDPNHLIQTYSSHPDYFNFDHGEAVDARNFYEYGFQNSRGFRALKVWMILQQAGRQGYRDMISTDIALAGSLFRLASEHADLEAISHHLSIAVFRYAPKGCPEEKLNTLNELLLNDLQRSGELFLSNALIDGKYCLRACIVNFRTSGDDIEAMVGIIVRRGRQLLSQL